VSGHVDEMEDRAVLAPHYSFWRSQIAPASKLKSRETGRSIGLGAEIESVLSG